MPGKNSTQRRKGAKAQSSGECVADADAYNARAIYWLPVERELPDGPATVLIYVPNVFPSDRVFLGYLDDGVWRSIHGDHMKVTHWADLPEPPEILKHPKS